MPESTVEIRNPGEIDLTQYRVEIGDTIRFVEKINDTQTDLENWAERLTFCAIDMQSAADQIGARYTSILQTGVQVGEDKSIVTQLKSDVTTLKEQSEAAAQTATDQAGIATAKAQTATNQAGIATAKAQTATNQAGIATSAATTATEQAGIATTKAAAALGSAQLSEYYAGQAENVSDITNIHLCGATVSAPAQVREQTSYEITLVGDSYLIDQTIVEFLVADNAGAYTIPAVANTATTTLTAAAYSAGDTIEITVVAVDSQGHHSPAGAATVSVSESQPPVGPITINHTSTVSKGGTFDLALSGVTDPDGDDAAIRYEITDTGILTFAKTTDIAAGELVQVTAPDVAVDTATTFSVRAYDDLGSYTATQSSSVNVVIASIIGVKLVATGGNGGTWSHINDVGEEITSPSTSWFNAHPVFGGIVDQVIDGQSMVKVPKFYYKRGTAADGKAAWWISDQQVAGFEIFPAFVLDSVEKDQFWYGKYQASESGGELQSIAGVLPKVSISLTDSLTAATARNVGGVEGFRLHHYDMWLAVQWLYLVENATMDSQTHTGDGRVTESSAANVDASDVAQATYRGMVGLWGNVYQWMDGVRTLNSVMERRSYTGSWVSTGQTVPNSGTDHYPLTFRSTAPDEFVADTFLAINRGATLPDYVRWRNGGEYYPVVRGSWSQAAIAGLWCVNCTYAASYSNTRIGARLARIV